MNSFTINPNVKWAQDKEGAILGYQDAAGYLQRLQSNVGFRTVLFGDSMTAHYNDALTTTTSSYDTNTGIFTLNLPSHGLITGMPLQIYSLREPGLSKSIDVLAIVIDGSTVSFQLEKGLNISPVSSEVIFVTYVHWIQGKNWFTWMNIKAGNRFQVVRNSGQSGDYVTNAVTRLRKTVAEHFPQVVFMQLPGINDIGGNLDENSIWQAQKEVLDFITSRALLVCITTTPVTSAHAIGSISYMSRVLSLRHKLMTYAKNNENIMLFDAYSKVIDAADSAGLGKAEYFLSDGIHYSPKGAYLVGSSLWDMIKERFPGPATDAVISNADSYTASAVTLTSLSRTNGRINAVLNAHGFYAGEDVKVVGGSSEVFNEWVQIDLAAVNTFSWLSPGNDGVITGTVTVGRSSNILANPLLPVTTGGNITGANLSGIAAAGVKVAQSGTWGTGGTAVCSVVANPNGFGNNQQVVVKPGTGTVSNPTVSIQILSSATMLPFARRGRKYYFNCEITVGNISGSTLTELRVRLIMTMDGNKYPEASVLKTSDNLLVEMPDGSYSIKTAEMEVPQGTLTAMQWSVDAKFKAVSSQEVTISIGRLSVREIR